MTICTKVCHRRKSTAYKVLRVSHDSDPSMHIYFCKQHQAWHIGHIMGLHPAVKGRMKMERINKLLDKVLGT